MKKNRKCDSRCHNAKGKVCKCWCNGQYHGLGSLKANKLFVKNNYWMKDIKRETLIISIGNNDVAFKTMHGIQLEIPFEEQIA